MWPTSKYERLEYDLRDSVNGCMDGERITFGILIADARQENAKSYIINYINELDKESESYFDFYIPGYTEDYYWGGKECFYLERNIILTRMILKIFAMNYITGLLLNIPKIRCLY